MRKTSTYSHVSKDDDSMTSSDSSQDEHHKYLTAAATQAAAVQLAQFQNEKLTTPDGKLDLQNLATMANVAGQLSIPSSAALLCSQEGQMYFPGVGDLSAYKLSQTTQAVAAAAAAHLMSTAQNSNHQLVNPNNPLNSNSHHNHSRNNASNNSSGIESISEESTRKREMRLLKNREAARECRRKKKEYIKCLENRVAVLETQNKALIDELKSLKELYCQSESSSKNH